MIIDLETLERLNRAESERDALKSEVERLTPMQFRPAPCHAACESTAFNIEIRKLKAELEALGHRSEALEVLSSAIDTLKTVAGNCEWSHSDFPVIARAEKLLQETPCTE